jgi:hypothetical protein
MEGVMSEWFFIFGIIILLNGLSTLWEHNEEQSWELADLDGEIKDAEFWGYDAESAHKARSEKIAEYKSWRNNIQFVLSNWKYDWQYFVIGGVLCLVATVLWFNENQAHIWDRLWDLFGAVIAGVIGWALYSRLIRQWGKAQREIRWLNSMLKQVKDHAENMRKASINDIAKVKDRLDKLEGKST